MIHPGDSRSSQFLVPSPRFSSWAAAARRAAGHQGGQGASRSSSADSASDEDVCVSTLHGAFADVSRSFCRCLRQTVTNENIGISN